MNAWRSVIEAKAHIDWPALGLSPGTPETEAVNVWMKHMNKVLGMTTVIAHLYNLAQQARWQGGT